MPTTHPRPRSLTALLAGILIISLTSALPSTGKAGQQEDRQVVKDTYKNEPIELVGLKSKKGKFKLKQKFTADDDWLDGFTVTILNRSAKTINSVAIQLFFPRPAGGQTPADPPYFYTLHLNADPFFYPSYVLRDMTKAIQPGETFDLVVPDDDYHQNRKFLAQLKYPPSINRVELSIISVGFTDETVWSGGSIYKRDPNNPERILKEDGEAAGRASSRPARFLARKTHGPLRAHLFVKASAAAPPAPQTEPTPCGARGTSLRDWCSLQNSGGQPLTCSKEYATLNTNSTDKSFELAAGMSGCMRWDTARNLWVSCGALEPAERLKACSSTPPPPDECQNDAPDDRYGNTIGLQTDGGTYPCASPVLVDVAGDGFALTDYEGGITFDMNNDGYLGRLSWTAEGADDAWLALDRDGNGLVDNGGELFGNFTPQPDPPAGEGRNGFLALAQFDRPQNGGNGDGVIDSSDAVFNALRLWRDENHDGVSQRPELHPLPSLDVMRLYLDYKESKRTDEHGNSFRYRAKLDGAKGAKAGRWAWDVFLLSR